MPTRRAVLRYGSLATSALAGCVIQSREEPDGSPSPTPEPTSTEVGGLTVEGGETRTSPPERCSSDRSADVEDDLAVEFDSRGAFRCRGRPFDDFEGLGEWEAEHGTASVRTSDVFGGSRAVALTGARSDERARLVRRFEDGIDLSGRDLSLAAKLEYPDQETVIVQVLAPDRENRLMMVHPIQRQWGWTRLDLGPTREVGEPDLTDVREIRVGMYLGEGREARLAVDAMRTTRSSDAGKVMLTFDDGKASQYETAFPILDRRGLPGVAGVIPWAVGSGPKFMSLEQVTDLHDAGWDVVSHPQLERPLPQYSPEKQEGAIRRSKKWLIERGFGDGARFVIWPFGEFDPVSIRAASAYHYLGFCGATCPSSLRFTGPLTITRANANELSVEDLATLVDLSSKYGQLLVITFHRVGPFDGQVDEKSFRRIVDYVDDSDLDVVTASELWDWSPRPTSH